MANQQSQTLILLLFYVCMFLYTLITLSCAPAGLETLSEKHVLNYVKKRSFPEVDVIILDPCITLSNSNPNQPTNFSALSVMRFAPWIRRIHLQSKPTKKQKDNYQHWKQNQHSRIVTFDEDLLTYSLTTPFLTECFLILQPEYLITNYIFNWQFFINGSPVLRTCMTGLTPLTRTIFNECVFKYDRNNQPELKTLLSYTYRLAIEEKQLKYINNQDHFVTPCSTRPTLSSSTKKMSVFNENSVKDYFHFEESNKDRSSKPFKIVIVLMSEWTDDLTYEIDPKYNNVVQVWINLFQKVHHGKRLSFLHRMLVKKNVFIELDAQSFGWNHEQIGAEIMKQLIKVSNNEKFEILETFSYMGNNSSTVCRNCNVIANKIGKVYSCPVSVFLPPTSSDNQERNRLKVL